MGIELDTGKYVIKVVGADYIRERWVDVETAIRKAFDGQEWVDEGYDVENAVRWTLDGVEGRLRPTGMKHILALANDGSIVGGFFCVASIRDPGETVCDDIGYFFVDFNVVGRPRLAIANELYYTMFRILADAGFERLETNISTVVGRKAMARRYGFVHAPTSERQNYWYRDLRNMGSSRA